MLRIVYTAILLLLFTLSTVSSSTAEEPNYGGTLNLATTSDPKTFNLIIAQETSTTSAISLLFEGLTKTNGVTTEPEPNLATEWTHTEDGLEWIFTLRKNVKWFDGTLFTADDVVFTFNNLIYNEKIPCSARDIFTINNKKFEVTKIDTHKVKIKTPTPYAPLLRNLSQPIFPKHILEKNVKQGTFTETWGINTTPKNIIGTGPFILTEYLPSQRLVYKKNPNYWQKGLPYIDKIVKYIVQDINVQILKFKSGEIDLISVPGRDYALLKKEAEKKNYTLYDCGAAFGTDFLCFNLNKQYIDEPKYNWFNNKKFRQAIAHALDKESMINNVLFSLGIPQYAAMNEAAHYFHNPDVRKYEYKVIESKKILKEAGFIDYDDDGIVENPKGVPVKFILLTNAENNIRVDLGTIIQNDLKAIGLDVSFRPLDFNNLVTKLNYSHDWEAILIGFTGGIEPHNGKNVWAIDGHLHIWNQKPEEKKEIEEWQKNIRSWESEIDELFNDGVQELNPEKRKLIYNKWQDIVAEYLPLIYTINPKAIYAVRNTIRGIHPTSYGGVLHNIEEIWIKKSNK